MTMSDTISALDRGLKVLDFLIHARKPRTYSAIKQELPGITDAAFSRLLKALAGSGYIQKLPTGLYSLTDHPKAWGPMLQPFGGWRVQVEKAVQALARDSAESAGMLVLENNQIEVVASQSNLNSISIIQAGGRFFFQAEHAAVLAICEHLSDRQIEQCLASPMTDIKDRLELEEALADCRLSSGLYADRSVIRPGISRCAASVTVPTSQGVLPGAIFICLTSEHLFANLKVLSEKVLRAAHQLQEEFTDCPV